MRLNAEDKILIRALRLETNLSLNRILAEYPNRNWNKTTVAHFLRKLSETGSIERRIGSGRPKTVRNAENVELVHDLIVSQENEPGTSKSLREIAKQSGIHRSSVQRIAKQDLRLKTFKRVAVTALSDAVKAKRLTRCKKLLRKFRSNNSVKKIWFSDEKKFTVETPRNSQNDRVQGAVSKKSDIEPSRLLRSRKHFSESVMVSLATSYDGKSSIIFVNRGIKINAKYYCEEILNPTLTEIKSKSPDCIFMQDGAPSHTAKHTVVYLNNNCSSFISPQEWPPCSPDLNPVDYFVWSALERLVYHDGVEIQNVNDLRRRILRAWQELPQDSINKAILKWPRRLQEVVNQNGGHIEPFILR
ncbi:Uncharacterised protein r2_g3551 [Pycnogonum litorale]